MQKNDDVEIQQSDEHSDAFAVKIIFPVSHLLYQCSNV